MVGNRQTHFFFKLKLFESFAVFLSKDLYLFPNYMNLWLFEVVSLYRTVTHLIAQPWCHSILFTEKYSWCQYKSHPCSRFSIDAGTNVPLGASIYRLTLGTTIYVSLTSIIPSVNSLSLVPEYTLSILAQVHMMSLLSSTFPLGKKANPSAYPIWLRSFFGTSQKPWKNYWPFREIS